MYGHGSSTKTRREEPELSLARPGLSGSPVRKTQGTKDDRHQQASEVFQEE